MSKPGPNAYVSKTKLCDACHDVLTGKMKEMTAATTYRLPAFRFYVVFKN